MKLENSLLKTVCSLGISCAFLLCVTAPVEAAALRSGEHVMVSQDQIVPGDFYAAGNDVYVSGVIEGDMYVVGGTVTLQGAVKGDVVVLGGTIVVDGDVAGDVRVIGGKASVSKQVGKDVVVVAGSLTVLPSAHVGGDVYFYGEEAEVNGVVGGTVTASANTLKINATTIAVDATVQKGLYIGPHAQIKKDITYQSTQDVVRAPESTVEGQIHKQAVPVATANPLQSLLPLWFMGLFSSLVMVLVFRDVLGKMLQERGNALGMNGVVGLGAIIATPVAAVLLCVTLVGVPLGALLILTYMVTCLLAFMAAPILLGAYLAKASGKGYLVTWMWTAVGVVLMNGALLVPIIGSIIVAGITIVAFGMLISYFHHTFRSVYG